MRLPIINYKIYHLISSYFKFQNLEQYIYGEQQWNYTKVADKKLTSISHSWSHTFYRAKSFAGHPTRTWGKSRYVFSNQYSGIY